LNGCGYRAHSESAIKSLVTGAIINGIKLDEIGADHSFVKSFTGLQMVRQARKATLFGPCGFENRPRAFTVP